MNGQWIVTLTYHFLKLLNVFASQSTIEEHEVVNFCYNASFQGFRLNVTVFKAILVSQWIECVVECIEELCCRSVNYKKTLVFENETNCEMLREVPCNTPEHLLEKNSSYDVLFFDETQKEYDSSCFPNVVHLEASCSISIEKKGCFKDVSSPSQRALPNLILTDRDSSHKLYSGKDIDWENWIKYLPDLVCRCAQEAKSKNFKFFGIQNYGECWSGPLQDESSYRVYGSSTKCVNTTYKACSDESKLACAGKASTNYVYAVVPSC